MSTDALLVALTAVFLLLVALFSVGFVVFELRSARNAVIGAFEAQFRSYFGTQAPVGTPPGEIRPAEIPAELRAMNELTQDTLNVIEESLINEHGYTPEQAKREVANVKAQVEGGMILP